MLKNAIVAVAFLAGGFALSSWRSTRAEHAKPHDVSTRAEQVVAPASAVDLAAMRTMIRQELQLARSQGVDVAAGGNAVGDCAPSDRDDLADPSAPAQARGRRATPTPAQAAAHAAAATLVDGGISLGRWTEQDEAQWQELEPELAPGAGQDVRGRLFEAVNDGRLVAEIRFGRRMGMPAPVPVQTN